METRGWSTWSALPIHSARCTCMPSGSVAPQGSFGCYLLFHVFSMVEPPIDWCKCSRRDPTPRCPRSSWNHWSDRPTSGWSSAAVVGVLHLPALPKNNLTLRKNWRFGRGFMAGGVGVEGHSLESPSIPLHLRSKSLCLIFIGKWRHGNTICICAWRGSDGVKCFWCFW